MVVRVKICGITNLEDALWAVECGADAIGFVFYKKSPRCVDEDAVKGIIEKLPPFVTTVGVFVNEPSKRINTLVDSTGLTAVQLHGEETPDACMSVKTKVIKAIRIKEGKEIEALSRYKASAFLLDAYKEGTPGGTGESFNWDRAAEVKLHGRVILAGGLTPENVVEAIKVVRPYGVDVSSGVESSAGKKDRLRVREFIQKVRSFCDDERPA